MTGYGISRARRDVCFTPKDGVIGRQLVDSWKILGAALQADGDTGSPW
jgi:hypothetical protein